MSDEPRSLDEYNETPWEQQFRHEPTLTPTHRERVRAKLALAWIRLRAWWRRNGAFILACLLMVETGFIAGLLALWIARW
jgi:hypothetical protein